MPDTRTEEQKRDGASLMHAYWNSTTYIRNPFIRFWISRLNSNCSIGFSLWWKHQMIYYWSNK
jgi:hypothetical protein